MAVRTHLCHGCTRTAPLAAVDAPTHGPLAPPERIRGMPFAAGAACYGIHGCIHGMMAHRRPVQTWMACQSNIGCMRQVHACAPTGGTRSVRVHTMQGQVTHPTVLMHPGRGSWHLHMGGRVHACVRSLVCVHACMPTACLQRCKQGGRLLAWLYMQVYIYIHRSLNISLLCVYMYVCVCLCIRVGGWMDGWMRMHGCVGLYAIYI